MREPTGWLTQNFVGTERHQGIVAIIESVNVGSGRLPYWRMPVKIFASMISVGAGASDEGRRCPVFPLVAGEGFDRFRSHIAAYFTLRSGARMGAPGVVYDDPKSGESQSPLQFVRGGVGDA